MSNRKLLALLMIPAIVTLFAIAGVTTWTVRKQAEGPRCVEAQADDPDRQYIERGIAAKSPNVQLTNLYFDLPPYDGRSNVSYTVYAGKLSDGRIAVWEGFFLFSELRGSVYSINEPAAAVSGITIDTTMTGSDLMKSEAGVNVWKCATGERKN